jgi:hypothetical protein
MGCSNSRSTVHTACPPLIYTTKVRKQHGLEAGQVLLGHSKADVTQIYAERDEALAIGIAAKIG